MAIQQINNGITGAEAAAIIYENDKQAIRPWDATEEYAAGEIAVYEGVIYTALAPTTGDNPEENPAAWRAAPSGTTQWDENKAYPKGAIVVWEGVIYEALHRIPAGTTPDGSGWRPLTGNPKVSFFDRPDDPYAHYLLDKNSRIIDRLLSDKKDGYRFLPEGISFYTIDRPDLGAIILVDKNERLINHSGGSVTPQPAPAQGIADATIYLPLWNPNEMPAFGVPVSGGGSRLADYDTLISDWDAVMAQANINPNIEDYVTKDSIGTSAVNDLPIYRYTLKPVDAKVKMLLIGGTHANEKMYVECVYQLFNAIVNEWYSSPFLEFLRWSAEIHFLPCRMPYSLSNDVRRRGFRVGAETPPIPISWSKTDNVVTLSFDVADFPNDGFLTGDSYFTSVPAASLENRTSIGIVGSSDEASLPLNAYRILEVLAGNSVTLETPDASPDTSGTGFLQVWTDPNRNFNNPNNDFWHGAFGSVTPQPADAGNVVGFIDNKGTQPLSLRENRAFLDLVLAEDFDFIIDGHAPAGDNDIRYDTTSGNFPNIEKIKSESAAFNSSVFNIYNRTGATSGASMIMPQGVMTNYYGQVFHTIEWGSGLYDATATQVRDALRWLGIVVKDTSINVLNKK